MTAITRSRSDDERNNGNFKSHTKLVSCTYDNLCGHYKNCMKMATYISKSTQNNLACIAEYIQDQIIGKSSHNLQVKFNRIVADEGTDSSNWEQLGVIVRYMEKNEPLERLIEYVKCTNISWEAIADLIGCLTGIGLSTDKCHCQAYDGAGNMAGKEKGAHNQFKFETKNGKAVYCSDYVHRCFLQLSSKALCKLNIY